MKLSCIKQKNILTATIALFSASAAYAYEPNTPFAIPTAATIGVAAGANPPPGNYFSISLRSTRGDIVDASGDKIGVSLNSNALALGYSYVPGIKILGGDYRFTATLPVVHVSQSTDISVVHVKTDDSGFGDIAISPFNLSWNLDKGLFASAGVAFNIPIESFNSDITTANVSAGKRSVSLLMGFSNLKDGWNQSIASSLTIYEENPHTHYKSGSELMFNLTVLKEIDNNFSVGPVGFWRKQLEDDENNGPLLGGGIRARAEQLGLGIGLAKNFGSGQINLNFVKNIRTRNTEDVPVLTLNYSMPFGK